MARIVLLCAFKYYEATRPVYSLVEMADKEMAQVAFHLGQCDTCMVDH